MGLAGPIAPGVMTMGIMAQFLTGHVAKGSLRLLDLVFRQAVTHGTVSLKAVVTSERDENGERLLSATFICPTSSRVTCRWEGDSSPAQTVSLAQ